MSLISLSQKQSLLPHSTRHTDHPRDNLGRDDVVCEHQERRPLGLSWSLATRLPFSHFHPAAFCSHTLTTSSLLALPSLGCRDSETLLNASLFYLLGKKENSSYTIGSARVTTLSSGLHLLKATNTSTSPLLLSLVHNSLTCIPMSPM